MRVGEKPESPVESWVPNPCRDVPPVRTVLQEIVTVYSLPPWVGEVQA